MKVTAPRAWGDYKIMKENRYRSKDELYTINTPCGKQIAHRRYSFFMQEGHWLCQWPSKQAPPRMRRRLFSDQAFCSTSSSGVLEAARSNSFMISSLGALVSRLTITMATQAHRKAGSSS